MGCQLGCRQSWRAADPNSTIGSMVLQPGESTYVESSIFMMHPGMDGQHDYAVHLKTNDAAKPDLVVHVLSDWGP